MMYSSANASELSNTSIHAGSQAPIRDAAIIATTKMTPPKIYLDLLGRLVIIGCLAEMLTPRFTDASTRFIS
jgi:hypothetical protein